MPFKLLTQTTVLNAMQTEEIHAHAHKMHRSSPTYDNLKNKIIGPKPKVSVIVAIKRYLLNVTKTKAAFRSRLYILQERYSLSLDGLYS